MKIKCLIVAIAGLTLASSCQENSYEGFATKGSVYFQTNMSNWTTVDTLVNYSFVGKTGDSDTIWLNVNLMGDPANVDREFKIAVDPTTTNAIEGQDYEALDEHYFIKSGEMTARVPLVVFRTERMAEEAVRIGLKLVATNDLELGIYNRLTLGIVLSNFLKEPIWWSNPYDPYVGTEWEGLYLMKAADYFGPYSRRKHELCVEMIGEDFPDDIYMLIYDDYWEAAMVYMSQYFKDNYPVYDENGEIIEPW